MATVQRTPRDIPFETDAEYQRLAEQHRQYEAELQRISKSPYPLPEFGRPPGRNQTEENEAPLQG